MLCNGWDAETLLAVVDEIARRRDGRMKNHRSRFGNRNGGSTASNGFGFDLMSLEELLKMNDEAAHASITCDQWDAATLLALRDEIARRMPTENSVHS